MENYLMPKMSSELRHVSVLGLAHVGDAVFELMVRTMLCDAGVSTAKKLHRESVTFVSAKAQAAASERLRPILSAEELAVFKRGRNAHVNSTPRGSSYEEYHAATGIEVLFGHLYLSGLTERLNELFKLIVEEQ